MKVISRQSVGCEITHEEIMINHNEVNYQIIVERKHFIKSKAIVHNVNIMGVPSLRIKMELEPFITELLNEI